MDDIEAQNHCTNKFIALANELKNEGHGPKLVSAALMAPKTPKPHNEYK